MGSKGKSRTSTGKKAKPLKLAKVLEMHVVEGEPTRLTIDGLPVEFNTLSIKADINLPFDLVSVNDAYSFDSEVWVNDELKFLMPSESSWTRGTIEQFLGNDVQGDPFDVPTDGNERLAMMNALISEREQHDGAVNQVIWQRIDRMHHVHCLNFDVLKQTFKEILADDVFIPEVIASTADPVKQRARMAKIDQAVYNFIGSGYALQEQTDAIIAPYKGTEFERRFRIKLAALEGAGPVSFARGLRGAVTHVKLPFTRQTFSVSDDGATTIAGIGLSPDELLFYDKWENPALDLIASSGDEVPLLPVLDEAFQHEYIFWSWTLRQAWALNKIHRLLVDEVSRELSWVQSFGRQGRPRRKWASGAFEDLAPAGTLAK